MRVPLAVIGFALALPVTAGGAQRLERVGASPAPHEASSYMSGAFVRRPMRSSGAVLDPHRLTRSAFPGDSLSPTTLWAVLASAVLPGSGQALLRQDRFVAYVALEAFGWARYLSDLREGRRQRDSYRGLARDVARATFSTVRPDGDFEYYERMEHFVESGAFDLVAGGVLEPEADPTTYNGSIWLLARQTFWEDPTIAPDQASPEYQRAEEFYRRRAVAESFRWSWQDAELEYDEFRRTIRRSNEAYRNSLAALGVIIANHALSTVDAFVTVRLRRRASGAHIYELTGSFPMGGPRRRLERD